MTKKERVLGTVTLIVSLLPYLLAAISLQYLPDKVPLVQLLTDKPQILVSKYNNLILGFFSIIPIGLVLMSRFLKSKMMVDRNFSSLLIAALLVSLVFLGMITFSLVKQSVGIDILYRVDVIGVIVVFLCLATAAFGGAMPFFTRNDFLGFRNRYTIKNAEVWRRVHSVGGELITALFLAISIPMPFLNGWIDITIFVLAVTAYYIVMYLYAKKYYAKCLAKQKSEHNKDDVAVTDI